MDFCFCVRVLVLSLLTFGQHVNALSYRSGSSNYIKPHFVYTRNDKLPLAAVFESSAQSGGFLGSSGSSHSAGGQVDRYSPEGSVSSYSSSSLNIRKPTQNSQQSRQTNPNANGVFQTKAGMWNLGSPQNGKRFESGIASSRGIVMHAGPQPPSIPEQLSYQPPSQSQQLGYREPVYPSRPQDSVYPSRPRDSVYPSKPLQHDYPSKPLQPVYPTKPQQPRFQQPDYPSKPLQFLNTF
ncbi:sporozoite surface protein 2-like [Cyclopterus lumpus]|uniref:sporozoite surface protein 2-like n=1 Tax=Cyclopterus lumpus TaxID=8103 RepID=UPI001485E865|nr:sporozoite surface protein 2-like [Cyclopterus lumpus]